MSGIITGLFHVAIKTADLDQTRRFYCGLLGLAEAARPDFGYPGAWIAVPTPVGEAIIHIYAGGPALGAAGKAPLGTAAIDHISLTATGYHDFIARFRRAGIDWREFLVPNTTYWQLFVYDPNGVQLELTFDGRAETGAPPDMSDERRYIAGASFFDAGRYTLAS
jgi:catechol 2,3-dioxygenase-like lactoylglutathione lyase family enzyme